MEPNRGIPFRSKTEIRLSEGHIQFNMKGNKNQPTGRLMYISIHQNLIPSESLRGRKQFVLIELLAQVTLSPRFFFVCPNQT